MITSSYLEKHTGAKLHNFLSRIKHGKKTNKTNDQKAKHKPAIHTHSRRKEQHRRDREEKDNMNTQE